MNFRFTYTLLISGVFLLFAGNFLNAQLQYPGKIRGDFSQLKAADVIYVLPPVDPLEIEARNQLNRESFKKPLQFAIERPVDLSPESHGSWMEIDGDRLWRIHIISPEAHSMGLIFNEYRLEQGVSLMIYDPDRKHIRGAFTSRNNKASGILPVGHIPGNELIIELQVQADVADYGNLSLESISHAFLPVAHPGAKKDGRFGRSQECEIDINCTEGADWQLTKNSVVRIFTSTQYCTGVLVNNTAYDGTPYLLTSEHCINKPYYADRSVFVFGYESLDCFGGDGNVNKSIAGCDTLAVGDSIDFSLVRLSVSPPDSFDVYYAGWDLDNAQNSGNTTIHHPEGDVKKISVDNNVASTPESKDVIPPGDLHDYHYFSYWWIKQWDIGTTEGGSSGSPLFNTGKRIIGILTGGYAKCGDSIDFDSQKERIIYNKALNINDFYTKINVAWDFYGESGPALKPWLDPGNTGVITLGGYLPSGDRPIFSSDLNSFNIYPNPASHILLIDCLKELTGSLSYRLFDTGGNCAKSGSFTGQNSFTIQIASLASGLYFLEINAGEIRESHKIIITGN